MAENVVETIKIQIKEQNIGDPIVQGKLYSASVHNILNDYRDNIRGCFEKFLTYYRGQQYLKVKVFRYSIYCPLNGIYLI